MKKYYLMGINKGNTNAICNLGTYYKKVEKNYDEMKKYYLMAIDKGDKTAMYNLAKYYRDIEKDHNNAAKYITMLLKSANIQEDCIVCYEHKQMYYTRCNRHYICNDCFIILFDKPCPYCRQ